MGIRGIVAEAGVFALAVVRRVAAYITGGLVAAVMAMWEHFTGRAVSWNVVVVGLVAALIVACFLAWRDEYRARGFLERSGPNIVLEFEPGVDPPGRWFLTNVGGTDALAVASSDLVLLDATARIDPLPRVGPRDRVAVLFQTWVGVRRMANEGHPYHLLEDALTRYALTTSDPLKTKALFVFPLRLTYTDVVGIEYENTLDIRWNGMQNQGTVYPKHWGVIKSLRRESRRNGPTLSRLVS